MIKNNAVLDAIRTRRSIRKYTGEPIAQPVRQAILEAAFCAPSAMNRRPFHFVSITDRALMQQLSDLHPYAKMLPQADWAILVCGDESVSGPFYMDDCAAATQNILLAAHSLGVGAVWCGVHAHRAPAVLWGTAGPAGTHQGLLPGGAWACRPRQGLPLTGWNRKRFTKTAGDASLQRERREPSR